MLELALPVVLTYLGLMTMGLEDLIYVGRLGPAALGAVGLGTALFSWFMIFGIGLLMGLEYLIAHAHGAGRAEECHRAWVQGLWVSVILGIPLTLLLILLAHHLSFLGVNGEVIPLAQDYLQTLAWSLTPIFFFTATRQYLQSMGIARPALAILILANVLNVLANNALVLGRWGFAASGVHGSAMATLLARSFLCLAMFAYLIGWDFRHHMHTRKLGFAFSRPVMLQLLRLGIPSALQMTFEVGVFALSTLLAARLTAESLAAHQIVLNVASLTFMAPLGIGSATAVLVSQELGKNQPKKATAMGWKGLRWGLSVMTLSGISFALFSGLIIHVYTRDASVFSVARQILWIAALFQLSDGAQTVAAGALRGLADTHTPMIANLVGHWLIGLPIGAVLCFGLGLGIVGLWIGLSVGLTSVALILVWRWRVLTSRITCQD